MSTITLIDNRELADAATNNSTSNVGEPSVGLVDRNVFVTGNWYASRSMDGGANWTHVDPFTTLPSAAGGFCCDQVVLHDHARGVWIWILQYSAQNGANVFRLAATRDANFPTGGWYYWDIAPTTLDGAWTNVWFDYPDAAVTNDNLFVTFNVFDASDDWQRAAVMRFPLDTIANAGTLIFDWWSTTDNGSLRLTQGAGPTMYWASHNTQQQLRLFSWVDGQGTINWWDINVAQWSGTISSTAPNGVDWLGRADGRITGASIGNGTICLMWTAGSGTNRPHAFCRVVRINEGNKNVVDQPDIWSENRAWAYPAACTNGAGVVGFTAFYGGADRNPGHVVGARDDAAGSWTTKYSKLGSDSPDAARWGDYLTCRAFAPADNTWVASGYTLEGGTARTDILPRIVHFALAVLPTGPTASGDDMQPGEVLNPGQAITSASGRYLFVYQGDGNLVLYDGGTPLWASNTAGTAPGVCIMQTDGNLVVYAASGQPVWDSGTWGQPGSHLLLQDDGNVVIYRPDGLAVWSTNTWLPTGPTAQGDDMQPGEVLNPDGAISSASGRYRFVYQGDGNLVLYDGGTPLWASNTDGRPVGVCIMQGDGNLVIYARGGQPIWDSGTWGQPGSRLLVQDDGNVVIYRPDGLAVWSTNTWLPTGPTAQGDDMQPGEVLNPDGAIISASGRYRFVYQGDGNLVLYDGGTPLWASNTSGRPVGVCIMQGDGNLVIYVRGGQPIWDSGTWGQPGSRLLVQDDGNVVIYRPDGLAVWSTNTWLPTGPTAQGDDMQPGEVLNPDGAISSASGRYRFVYQGDGNLVLYDGGTPLWASNTSGRPVGVCIMQGDGNLVIYARGGQPIWDSGTWGQPGSRLLVQDDGNVVIYRPDGVPVWATNTVQ